MSDLIDNAKEKIEAISLEVVTMEENDIPAMGKILNLLCDMEKDAEKIGRLDFSNLISGLNIYLEKAVFGEIDNFELFEQGLDHLSAIHRCICNDEEYTNDISDLLNELGFKQSDSGEETKESRNDQTEIESDTETESTEDDESHAHPDDKKEIKEDIKPPDQDLSAEDREILSDFVMESLESLETVEVSLMDLEQDPGDLDSINAIFRSFHTIKGVSAFLDLERINMLAHRAENLLDKARSGEISIEATVIDIILESVDSLKKLIIGVQNGLENGISLDMGLDITPLVNRIDEIQVEADQIGDKPVGEIMIQKGEITPERTGKRA